MPYYSNAKALAPMAKQQNFMMIKLDRHAI